MFPEDLAVGDAVCHVQAYQFGVLQFNSVVHAAED